MLSPLVAVILRLSLASAEAPFCGISSEVPHAHAERRIVYWTPYRGETHT